MAPLVPDIISNELNLVVALIIGFFFGFVLEQAGFSSTKKLVGLFYGYDFTVLKVFFTAGVTAMIGVVILGHFGMLDLELIYINPTFLWSALVGGLIMGVGFIIGGFCPGTSVCAAAIGKVDAMFFLLGSFIGVFLFTEMYPAIENLYLAENWGAVRINEFFGLNRIAFAFIMTAVAIMAFYVTQKIQNNVNKLKPVYSRKEKIRWGALSILPFVILLFLTFLPDYNQHIENQIAEARRQQKCVFKEINTDKLAFEIINNYYNINIIDVRSPEEYKAYHIPMAINIPFDSLLNREWRSYFKQTQKHNILYSDNDTLTRKSCLKAKFIGPSENFILKGSSVNFYEAFHNLKEPPAGSTKKEVDEYRFRVQAARQMADLVKSLKNLNQPVKKTVKKIKGGCS